MSQKPKISLKMLQKDRAQGGLNLVNLAAKEISLKATWPQILHNNSEYANLVFALIAPQLKMDIFQCNIAPADVHFIVNKEKDPFWFDVLTAWAKIYYMKNGVFARPIWMNSDIKVSGEPILWNRALVNGLMYLHQPDELDSAQIYQRYGLSVMQLNALTSIKCRYSDQRYAAQPHTLDELLSNKNCQNMYMDY